MTDEKTTDRGRGDDDRRWRALCARRASADFVYAVLTTGVFCRPGCPSRRPARRNVLFFDDARAAVAAGFRPCRRCRPATTDGDAVPDWLEAAARAMEADPSRAVAEVARACGVERTTLHRGFVRVLGLAPGAYRAAVRARRLRGALGDGTSVTDALLAAGHGSPSAGWAAAGETLGAPPGRVAAGGRGLALAWIGVEGPLGPMVIAWSDRGVALVEFLDDESAEARVRRRFPAAECVEATAAGPWVTAVLEVVAGRASPETVPLDIRGTAFQQRVWAALRTLRPGERVSYGELAARIGRPEAARAVAGACGANRHAVLVPCHRVVAADGGLGGYRWGEGRKRTLLEREASTPGQRRLRRGSRDA